VHSRISRTTMEDKNIKMLIIIIMKHCIHSLLFSEGHCWKVWVNVSSIIYQFTSTTSVTRISLNNFMKVDASSETISDLHYERVSLSRFEAFTTVKFQVEIFWVLTPCSFVVRYKSFGGPFCLHLQGEVKRWYPTAALHGVTIKNTSYLEYIVV
jgi:hypothetical protein